MHTNVYKYYQNKICTLQARRVKKEYEQNRSYSFCFLVGKTCFMEGAPSGVLFLFLSTKTFRRGVSLLF